MEKNYVIDLVDIEKSDIKYKISQFPDGQQNVKLGLDYLIGEYINGTKINISIICRVNNWKDLEVLIATVACLKDSGIINERHLLLPYLLGARSDRKFEDGGNNYLKDVISPAINSMDFHSVIITDPHSDVTEALINNIEIINNIDFIDWVLTDFDEENVNLICPDAGAQKKMWNLVEKLELEQGFITATKHRDVKTGKITHTSCPIVLSNIGKPYIIIDDICDGGRTFIEIAKAIKIQDFNSEIYLAVTHGIFSAGFEELQKYFKRIYCTNSYSDIEDNYSFHGEVKQLNGFIKQYPII